MLILHHFQIPQLNRHRTIRVYLPPSYQKGDRRYSVIYMHDGQNLFEKHTAFGRPWHIGKMIDKMPIRKQAIVVGIDNGGVDRMQEYAPFKRGHHGGQGDPYLQFIVENLKPFMDQNYRTLASPDHTWMVGSSLGGLITFHAGLRFPHVFGKIGVLSPAFWFNPQVLQQGPNGPVSENKFYLVGSRTESRGMAPGLQNGYWKLKNAGVRDENLKVIIREKGGHNEAFWAREFKKMHLEWMSN